MPALKSLILRDGDYDTHTDFPLDFITGTGLSPRPRLRVDQSQTSFYESRQFRVFHEFSLNSGQSVWLRFVLAQDAVVLDRALTVVQGNLRLALSSGGTPSGTWTPKTVFRINSMANAPVYTASTTADAGGTVTGGTERDIELIETGTSQAVTVHSDAPEVGFAAGTYYVELRNSGTGTLRGIYKVLFEEYQPRSSSIY